MAKKPKLGRGRPTKELQQYLELLDEQDRGKATFLASYGKAMEYIAQVAAGEIKTTDTIRLNATKVVKDAVESWLEDYEKANAEDSEETDSSPSEQVIRIG